MMQAHTDGKVHMSDLVIRSTNVPAEFDKQMDMARAFAASSLLPAHLRDKPANVLVILDGARALDVPSFWAFQSMYVVEGKLSLSAELMRALVIRAGHTFRVVEHTNQRAKIQIVRKDDPEFTFESEFTLDDARQAGLINKNTWKNYTKAMLLARATSQGVRAHTPDVLFGVVYTPEELGAQVDGDGEPVVDNTGRIVIEGQSQETTIDQEAIDHAAEVIATDGLVDAADTYLAMSRLDWGHKFPTGTDPDSTLYLLWLSRLSTAIKYTPGDLELRKKELKRIWQYANGTGVLNGKYGGSTISEQIDARLKDPASATSGADYFPMDAAGAPQTDAEAIVNLTEGGVVEGEVMTEGR